MGFLEQLSPTTLRQPAIGIQLAHPLDPRRPGQAIRFLVSVDASLAPRGLILPIEEMITGPGGTIVRQTHHRLLLAEALTFTPRKGGNFMLLLRELAHDMHYGTFAFSVSG